ncbi:13534_t:CDS:2 [Acaulospora morrowiae]|uniref:13534_t:CDS:1 n=1 Tax=Acaulospora morrowiae TaxID=94023 RepID=A0A9N9NGP9_9GLOM|nr:13534_t:CDS:2 [Acaulospora morrowiae]
MPRKTRTSPTVTQKKKHVSTMPSRPAPAPATVAPSKSAQNSNVPANTSDPPTSLTTPKQPSLLGQVASTAAGVAIGHSVGQGITSLFSGGGSSVTETQEKPKYQDSQTDGRHVACEADTRALKNCLEQNNYDVNVCQWYLENLKACQQMASQY